MSNEFNECYKEVQNLTVQRLAKRKGIAASDMNQFVFEAAPKVMSFLMIYDLQPTAENFDNHYGHIMDFIGKSDAEIEQLVADAEEGKSPAKLAVEPQKAEKEVEGLGLKTMFLIVAFLFVAWQIGKNVFYVALALVGLWMWSEWQNNSKSTTDYA